MIGEGKLENFLEEHPPVELNINQAKIGLIEAKRYLQMVTNDAGIQVTYPMNFIIFKIFKLH